MHFSIRLQLFALATVYLTTANLGGRHIHRVSSIFDVNLTFTESNQRLDTISLAPVTTDMVSRCILLRTHFRYYPCLILY